MCGSQVSLNEQLTIPALRQLGSFTVRIMNLKSELLDNPFPLNEQYSGYLLSQLLSSLVVSSGL